MKKIIVSAAAIAILGGMATFASPAYAQGTKTASHMPHKVGLIDMAHVFKKYDKFKMLREDLKAEITRSDEQAKAKVESVKKLQQQLKNGGYKEGSPEYLRLEKQLAKEASEFEAYRKVAQRDFVRKESKIYKTVYLEVADAVRSYAEYKNYTLVLRFNREGLVATGNPQEVIKSMNRQVVYFQPNDDITEPILKYLNAQYSRTAKGGSSRRQSRRQ